LTTKIEINGTDVADYVISCGKIPHIKRNRMHEPLAGTFDFEVTDKASPIKGQGIVVKVENINRFYGFISRVDYNYEKKAYKVEVTSKLLLLKRFRIDYTTLQTAISSGASSNQYRAIDNQGYPNVALLWLLKKMFIIAGLVLDTSNVDSELKESGGIYGTIYYSDIVMDVNMLYALNQTDAVNRLVIDCQPIYGDNTFEDKKVTFFEFFQRICIGMKLCVQPSTTANTYVIKLNVTPAAGNYVVSNNDKIGYNVVGTDLDSSITAKLQVYYGADNYANFRAAYTGMTFTATGSSYSLNMVAHGLSEGSVIKFTTTTTLPAPLVAATDYYISNVYDVDNIYVALAPDGSSILMTDAGTGTHTAFSLNPIKLGERQGYGNYHVPYWNNLRLMYHESGTTVGSVQTNYPQTVIALYGGYDLYKGDPEYEVIECMTLDFTKYRIMEHWIDPANQLHIIKQETT